MVRALLRDVDPKGQSRRAFSARMLKFMQLAARAGEVTDFLANGALGQFDLSYILDHCPYGKAGDRLWVKETYRTPRGWDNHKPSDISAGRAAIWYEASQHWSPTDEEGFESGKLRPSIFMPRWASRITLEIIDVRVERLKDISANDVIAEGVTAAGLPLRTHYATLWELINGPGSWTLNPWVWVLTFRTV